MLQLALRVFLVLSLMAVMMTYVEDRSLLPEYSPYLIIGALVLGIAVIAIEASIPRKSLQALSGLFFGLIVGLLISYGLNIIFDYVVRVYVPQQSGLPVVEASKLLFNIICCYLCVSFVLQTKDDVRFVIPYVEFARQVKGQRPILLDTSVIIDGRITAICDAGFLNHPLLIPRCVLDELQLVADSSDKMKRSRGRRGLDVLKELQDNDKLDVQITDEPVPRSEAVEGVDLKLLVLAKILNGRVATNDYNLNKVAQVRGVEVLNINDLAIAVKPVALPGESMTVKIIRAGEEQGQGVGYLDDGTMVVVEHGRDRIGERVDVIVTSNLQTSAGRMIFGRIDGVSPHASRRRHPAPQQRT